MTDAVDEMLNEREATHGKFLDHARVTQRLKDAMRDAPNWEILYDTQMESLEMIQHKIGRILAGSPDHEDHWADIEGYARLGRMSADKSLEELIAMMEAGEVGVEDGA